MRKKRISETCQRNEITGSLEEKSCHSYDFVRKEKLRKKNVITFVSFREPGNVVEDGVVCRTATQFFFVEPDCEVQERFPKNADVTAASCLVLFLRDKC